MKKTTEPERGDAYKLVRKVYDSSPGRSWRRLNGALQNAMDAALIGHLSFKPDDFATISREMKGNYWLGNSEGSTCGERYYSMAVKVGHTAACISFERYAGRPAVLWAEKVKTTERLCVGSDFTWGGLLVSVTSIKSDHLIACTYKAHENTEFSVGHLSWAGNDYRMVEDIDDSVPGHLTVRYGAVTPQDQMRKIDRRFRVLFTEISGARKAFDSRKRALIREIEAATTLEALGEIQDRKRERSEFRHFDIEEIRTVIHEKQKSFGEEVNRKAAAESERVKLERWMRGENVAAWFKTVRLRVRDGFVETSTGQSVKTRDAALMLPWALRSKDKRGPVSGKSVGIYPIENISDRGVKVGCTLIPWGEIERIAPELSV